MSMNLDRKLVEDKLVGFGDNQIEKYDSNINEAKPRTTKHELQLLSKRHNLYFSISVTSRMRRIICNKGTYLHHLDSFNNLYTF